MNEERRTAWARDGLFIVPRLFDDAWVRRLAGACDLALERVRATSTETGHTTTNISPLSHPEHFADNADALECLAALPASSAVVALVSDLSLVDGEGDLNLRDLQYFHEPKRDYDGDWHRDITHPTTLLRFRVALAQDDHLEYVLGSHTRADTDDEHRVLTGSQRSGPLPSKALHVHLEPGDVCVFHAGGIHRARYRARTVRRTLDALFGFGMRKRTFDPALLELARAASRQPAS